jgi:hypothetical protein
MSRAPIASALISIFVRDIPHSLLILLHDFIGQRWPSSVIAGCRTAPGRPRPPRQLPRAALVVMRKDASGRRRSIAVGEIPKPSRERTPRMARLHMDATRSGSLFAERLVLVEGVTDAVVLRQLGAVWAGGDTLKLGFIDALTITVLGTKVGPGPGALWSGVDRSAGPAVQAQRLHAPDVVALVVQGRAKRGPGNRRVVGQVRGAVCAGGW